MEMVELERIESAAEIQEVRALIERHVAYTDSSVGRAVLANWEQALGQFVKVMPTDYKRVLQAREAAVSAG